jgi:hypothetical protein
MPLDTRMRILALVVVLVSFAGFSGGVFGPLAGVAHADDAQRAKELYEAGTRYFDLGQFDKAIDAWQAGYREKSDSRFLYNIAQAYRLAGDLNKAIFFYKGYLRNSPKASNRPEVELKIQALQKQLGEQEQARAAGPSSRIPNPPPPAPAAAAPPPAPSATAPPPSPAGAADPTSTSTSPPTSTSGLAAREPSAVDPAGSASSPVVSTPAPEALVPETLRPVDLRIAIGVDGWTSGVQGKADASFALVLAGGYTWGHDPAAAVRFRMGGHVGYTFLKEAQSRETFLSFLIVPTLAIRASPRLTFFGELGLGLMAVSGLAPTSALLDKTVSLRIDGTQSLGVVRPAIDLVFYLTPALGLFAAVASSYSPKGEHFYQAINRTEVLVGMAVRL